MTKPKIIFFDLESVPILSEAFHFFKDLSNYPGLTLKASINSVLCFGYKILGEKKVRCINAWDFPQWKTDINDDYQVVKAAYEILLTADAIVTHNGKRFDEKFLRTRLLHHGLPQLPKIKHVDTCQVARTKLLVFNNRLNTISRLILRKQKLDTGGWKLWQDVANRNPRAQKLMTAYCKQDVLLLESIYKKLLPLITDLPNHQIFSDNPMSCENCGSKYVTRRGFNVNKRTKSRRYQCQDCGSWMSVKM